MPTIKANEKQLSALKDIETALKIVSDINAISAHIPTSAFPARKERAGPPRNTLWCWMTERRRRF